MKELLQKEVIIIDREEYVKVPNPRASEGVDQPKYLYVPVEEYLSKREAFATPADRKEDAKNELPVSANPLSLAEKETFTVSSPVTTRMDLKKKVLLVHFDDRTTDAEEVFGDWVAEKLAKEVSRRSGQIVFVDYPMAKDFLEKRGIALSNLEGLNTLHLLNEALGVRALVIGQLAGPYLFTARPANQTDVTASAIVKIETKIVDTLSGKTVKNLSASNPVVASKGKGAFSEEKAKTRAIDLVIYEMSRELSKELDRLDWFGRVVKVEGEEIYINAGKLTGLKVGDVMEVLDPERPGEKREAKGRIEVSALLGIDASMAKLIDGKKPDVSDILKLAKGI